MQARHIQGSTIMQAKRQKVIDPLYQQNQDALLQGFFRAFYGKRKLGHEMAIHTRSVNGFDELHYPLVRISYVNIRNSLLNSCLTISGFTNEGNLLTTTILFNSVGTYLFAPILERIRSGAAFGGARKSFRLFYGARSRLSRSRFSA